MKRLKKYLQALKTPETVEAQFTRRYQRRLRGAMWVLRITIAACLTSFASLVLAVAWNEEALGSMFVYAGFAAVIGVVFSLQILPPLKPAELTVPRAQK